MAKVANGRVALITGGASGIGLATAKRLLEAGWKVALADRDEKLLAAVRASWARPSACSPRPSTSPTRRRPRRWWRMSAEALGGLDGVVNSAGIAADIHALDTPVDLFRKILDVNVVGTFIVARAAARIMKDRGGGSIVNISSISGVRGSKGRSAYGSSKGAVIVLTQVLANDLGRYGIRVNAVAPGPVDTPMVKELHSEADRKLWLRYLPLRRYGTPEEIAMAIEFLLDGTQLGLHHRRGPRRRRRLPRGRHHAGLRDTGLRGAVSRYIVPATSSSWRPAWSASRGRTPDADHRRPGAFL